MLQSFRQMGTSWAFKGLMMVLVLSFGVWGVGDMVRGNPMQRTIASAGDDSFTVQDISREFDRTMIRVRQMMGPDITRERAKELGILDKSLDVMLDRSLEDQNIKRLGVLVDEKTFVNRVASEPRFRNPDGSLNKEMLRRALDQERINEKNFADEGARDMARMAILNSLTAGAAAPKSMIDALYRARGQKRFFDVVTLKNDSLPEVAAPDEKTLKAYYDANLTRFTAPEYRAVTVARLSADDLAKDITLSEDEVKKAYDERQSQYAVPESRDIVHVVLPSEDKAKQLVAAARDSGSLTASAQAMGLKATPQDKTVESDLLPEIAKPVFALTAPEIAEPVKSPLGWHVVEVKRIHPATHKDFASVKAELRTTLQKERAADSAANLVNKLDDDLAAGHALDEIASALKLHLTKIAAVDVLGKTPDGKTDAGLAEDLLKAAFTQNSGETSPVQDDRNGNYTVIRTESITPSTPIPFEKARALVLDVWQAAEQTKQAQAEAEKIAARLREGKAAASFAGHRGVEVTTSKPLSVLDAKDPRFSTAEMPRLMRLKKGEVAVLAQGATQTIVRLARVEDVDPEDETPAKGGVASMLNAQMPRELTEQYVRSLRTVFTVKVDRAALNALTVQGE